MPRILIAAVVVLVLTGMIGLELAKGLIAGAYAVQTRDHPIQRRSLSVIGFYRDSGMPGEQPIDHLIFGDNCMSCPWVPSASDLVRNGPTTFETARLTPFIYVRIRSGIGTPHEATELMVWADTVLPGYYFDVPRTIEPAVVADRPLRWSLPTDVEPTTIQPQTILCAGDDRDEPVATAPIGPNP